MKRTPDIAYAPLHEDVPGQRLHPPRTKQQLKAYVDALLYERQGYVARGDTAAADGVTAELKRNGHTDG